MILMVSFSIYPLVALIIEVANDNRTNLRIFIVGIIGWVILLVFFIVLTSFFMYHIRLIRKNKTTLEILDVKRGNDYHFTYDMGTK